LKSTLAVLFVATLSACNSLSDKSIKGYEGPSLPLEEVSTIQLQMGFSSWLSVNGHNITNEEYGEIQLLPGRYNLAWSKKFAVSVLLVSSGSDTRDWSTILDLQPGKTYTIYCDRTTGHGYRTYSWIEDGSGRVIWGEKLFAQVDEYDKAAAAYNAGEYGGVFEVFMRFAEQGELNAQADVGTLYMHGHGVAQDREKAVYWWEKAAAKGNNRAQGYLGDLYFDEQSEYHSYETAFKFYAMSARQNDAISQARLAYMYAEGLGVPVDFEMAEKWWESAAALGNENAVKNLARARQLGLIE
jgi:TPR repeat protein